VPFASVFYLAREINIFNSAETLFVDPLQKAITAISPLSPESQPVFFNAWKYWAVTRDHYLLREHAVSDYIYFIQKGVARIYYYKNDKEITEWIAMDEQFFLSITSFFQRVPSHLIIQTIEPSELYGIHHNDFMALADQYHDVEKLLRKMVTASLILSQIRMDSIQFETAQQRYDRLLKNSPEIIQRVPVSYIASFLGVTPETLSRIRAQK
jgi:CRP-like cAMP-binding protein